MDDLSTADGATGYADVLIHGVTGQGLNDYDAICSRLAGAGYNGWISIEDGENGMDEMTESINFLKQMRTKYWSA